MNQLTKLLGSHLEYIGEFCETDKRITQNPAFSRMIQLKDESKICVVDKHGPSYITSAVEVSNYYDKDIEIDTEQRFYLHGQPILIVRSDSIIMCKSIKAGSDHFGMVKFHVDVHDNLHVKVMEFVANMIDVSNSIYDAHGVELQQDSLTDIAPKSLKKSLSSFASDSVGYAKTLYEYLLQFKFDCSLGRTPLYKETKKASYLGYRRDLRHIEFVLSIHNNGFSRKERLDINDSPATMAISRAETYPATKEELAKGIAEEENEETRTALIGYCARRGVTKEMVAGIGFGKK